jgi:hypothetical protein
MAQAESWSESARGKSTKSGDSLQIGATHMASLMDMQRELLGTLEQIQRDQLARTMEGTKLVADLAAKVTSARSIPDIVTIYQEWITRHMELFAEDSRRFLNDSQKIANATTRMLSQREGGTST